MSKFTTPEISRRRLMLAGASAAGAVAAAAALTPGTRDAAAPSATAPGESAQGGGYRITQHVLRYYATARV